MHRFKRLIFITLRLGSRILIYFSTLLLSLGLLVSTDWAQDQLKSFLISKFNNSYQAHLQLEEWRFSFFFGLQMKSLLLDLPSGHRVSIDQVAMDLPNWKPFKGELVFNKIDIFQGKISFQPSESSKDGIPLTISRFLSEAIPRLPFKSIAVKNFQIHGTNFALPLIAEETDHKNLDFMLIQGQGFYANDEEAPRINLSFTAYKGGSSLFYPAKIETLKIVSTLTNGTFEFNDIELKTKNSLLSSHGSIQTSDNLIHLEIKADPLEAADLSSAYLFGKLPTSFKNAALQLNLDGAPTDLHFSASLTTNAFRLTSNGLIDLSNLTIPTYSMNAQLSSLDTSFLSQKLDENLPSFNSFKAEPLNLAWQFTGRGLKLSEIEGTLTLGIVPSSKIPKNFRQTELVALINKGELTIKEGTLESEAGKLMFEGGFNLSGLFHQEEDLHFKIKAKSDRFNLARITGNKDLAGELNFSLASQGRKKAHQPWTNLEAEIQADIRPSKVGPITFSRSSLDVSLKNGKLSFTELNINSKNNQLHLKGYATREGVIDLKYTLKAKDYSLLSFLYPQASFKGESEGSGTIKGTWPNLLVDGKLKIREFSGAGLSVSTGTVEFASEKKTTIPIIKAGISLNSVKYKELSMENLKGSLKIEGSETQFHLSASLPKKGSILVHGQGHNLLAREKDLLLDKLEITDAGSTWKNTAKLTLKIHPTGMTMGNITLANPPQEISIAGFLAFSGPSNLQLLAHKLELNTLYRHGLLKESMHGKLDAKLDWQGNFQKPEVKGFLRASDLKYREFAWDELDLTIDHGANKSTISAVLTQKKTESFRVKGFIENLDLSTFPSSLRNAVISMELRSKDLNLSMFTPLSPHLHHLTGFLTMEMQVEGRLLKPNFNGTVQIDEGRLPFIFNTQETSGSLDFQELKLNVVDFSPDNPEKGEMRLSGSSLTVKDQKIESLLVTAKGEKGGWQIQANVTDTDNNYLSAEALVRHAQDYRFNKIEIRKIDFKVLDEWWRSEGSLDVNLNNGLQLEIASFRIKRGAEEIAFRGQFTKGNVELDIESKLSDSSVLTEMLRAKKYVKLTGGNFDIKASVKGNINQLELKGSAQAQAWNVAIPAWGGKYTLEKALIRFNGSRAELEEFVLKGSKGVMTAKGFLSFKGYTVEQIKITAANDNFQSADSGKYAFQSSGWASLTGNLERPEIQGEQTIKKAVINLKKEMETYHPDIKFSKDNKLQGKVVVSKEGTGNAFWKSVALNMKVNIPAYFWIKGDNFNMELAGGGSIFKEPHRPVHYSGNIHTVRGNYHTYGRNFIFEQGLIDLPGIPTFNPYLDMLATYKVANVKIMAVVKGTLMKPDITFKSDPPLTEPEIFSYLAFGKSPSQLNEREANSFQYQAASFLGGRLATEFKDIFGEKFPLDTVEITSSQGATAGGTAQVGKYLSDKLYFQYGHTFGTETNNTVSMEYKLGKYFTLQSDIGGKGESGVDIIFNLDY